MKCEDCKNISNCKDKRDNPSFYGCTSGVPDNPIIKPCPFCGSEAKFNERYRHSICCANRKCIISAPTMMYKNKDVAIEEWNKRV